MLMTKKELSSFCISFAFKFISSECMEESFAPLKCRDAQLVSIHLRNKLELDLQDWLEANNIEIED